MFELKETERYNVKTKEVLKDAIEDAYFKAQSTMPKEAPDKFLLISSLLSYAILIFMTIITAMKETGNQMYLWYGVCAACVALLGITVYKYLKSVKEYKNDRGTVNKAEKKVDAFMQLFDVNNLPETMSATELAKKVSALLGKQSDNIFNNALRTLASILNAKNNPQDILCKSLTPMGELFPYPRKRFYFKRAGDKFVFYDSEFADPEGELTCDEDDLLAFGPFSSYSDTDKNIINKSGKIKSDSFIMKISDGISYYFFEFQSVDIPKLKKLIPGKKEL